MSNEFSIRVANSDDISKIVELNQIEMFGEVKENISKNESWKDGLWWCNEDLLRWYWSCLLHSGGGVIIAEFKGKIIGELDYCFSFDNIFSFKGDRRHIIWLLIHPNHRKLGIATQLINFLLLRSETPVWVEPEDNKSINLYNKYGFQNYTISNWELKIDNITNYIVDNRLDSKILPLEQIANISQNFSLLLGRYYAPNYDIQQFIHSNDVKEYLWGDTNIPNIGYYKIESTEVYAVLTQYPRIWVYEKYQIENLKKIIAAISLDILELGFDIIYLQIYNKPELVKLLESLNYNCKIHEDPVFMLNP